MFDFFFLLFFTFSVYSMIQQRHSLVTLKTEMSLHNFECIYFYDYYRVAFIIIFISNRVSIRFEVMLSLSSYLNWDFLVFMRKRQINHWNIKKLAKYEHSTDLAQYFHFASIYVAIDRCQFFLFEWKHKTEWLQIEWKALNQRC